MLTMELNISRFSFLSNVIEHYGRFTFKNQVKENCTLLHRMVPVPARLSTCKIFQLSEGIILALCGRFQKALCLGTPRKVKSHDHTIVSRSAMEKINSKRVS